MLLSILKKYTIFLIIILAILVRSWDIASTPALNPDEAAIGYNAYSLLETGKDEHGAVFPLHFKSFGDYKPGGYFYLVLPFVKFLGLTPLAVRLPNLILSVACIYFLYKLILLLTTNYSLSTLTSLVLSVNPWHIHFSRGGWEASAALSFIVIGTYFFFKFLKLRITVYFLLFTIFYVFSLYTYHSARLIAPLLALSLFITNYHLLITNYKKLIFPLIFGIIICLPVAYSFLTSGGSARFSGVGLTADQGPVWRSNELLNHHMNTKLINRITHNKRILYLISWAQKYSSHFDLNFLFINGDEVPRSKVPDMGQLYLIELPFLILGIYFLIHKSYFINRKSKQFIFSWLLIAPVASSLTFQAPSALRSLPMTIPLSIIVASGIYYFCTILKSFFLNNKLLLVTSYVLLFTIYLYSFTYYLDAYFVHYPRRFPFAWQYGFPEAVAVVQQEYPHFDHIYVTNKYDQPYILFLFYSKYNPSLIQSEIQLTPPDNFGFSTVTHFGKYNFQKIEWNSIPANSLVLASDEPVPKIPHKIINFPNGQPAFKIYTKE